MADLVHLDYLFLNVLSRFGIHLGFADATVDEVCKEYNIDTNFFLDIANTYHFKDYFPQKQLQRYPVQPILQYLRNTHFYYINQKLPELEMLLNETIRVCYKEEKTQQLLIRFFSGYSEQLTRHIDKEEKEVFPYVYWLEACQGNEIVSEEMTEKYKCYSIEHYRNTHDDIEEKLADLQNLIIKYLPPPDNLYACNKLLFEIFALENDINYHSRIEEKVLIPKSLEMEAGLKSKLTKQNS
ncbi:MAG TPA: hypothetical protein VHO90_00120 [Bacteroidales bacterium]|nr:hypothetical protein [Bacteroidales bacterium]